MTDQARSEDVVGKVKGRHTPYSAIAIEEAARMTKGLPRHSDPHATIAAENLYLRAQLSDAQAALNTAEGERFQAEAELNAIRETLRHAGSLISWSISHADECLGDRPAKMEAMCQSRDRELRAILSEATSSPPAEKDLS